MTVNIRKFKTLKGHKEEEVCAKLRKDIVRINKDQPDGYMMIWKRGTTLKTHGHAGFSALELLGAIESLKSDLIENWNNSERI